MLEVLRKYKEGEKIEIGKSKAIITTGLMKFKNFYAIYADIIENIDCIQGCGVCKINDKIALIIRNKKILLEMRIK